MNVLQTAANAAAAAGQRPAAPNVDAQSLRALGAAWQAVFDQRGDSPGPPSGTPKRGHPASTDASSGKRDRHAGELRERTLAADTHDPTAPAQSAPTGSLGPRSLGPALPAPRQAAVAYGGLPSAVTVPITPAAPPSASRLERTAAGDFAAPLPQPAADTAGDSVTVVVMRGEVEIIARDAALGDQDALRRAFDAAAHLTGQRSSLRRLTMNGHEVYVRPESQPAAAPPRLRRSY